MRKALPARRIRSRADSGSERMWSRTLAAVLALVLWGIAAPRAVRQGEGRTESPAARHRATLDRYCVTCHNDRLKTSNLSLEQLDLSTAGDHPEIWERVVRKLRAGVMPPPDIRRPSLADYDALRDFLESELDKRAAARVNPGS